MTHHETLPKDCLLLTADDCGCFAMAFILQGRIYTAGHVAQGHPTILLPSLKEATRSALELIEGRDLAVSSFKTITKGFSRVAKPKLGQLLTLVGYHGFQHTPFEIEGMVIKILLDGRVIVEWLGGTNAQVGMSGSPAVTEQDEVVGILVSDVEGTNGNQLYLESVANLIPTSPPSIPLS